MLLIGGAVCFGVVATLAEHSRASAARAARTETEPLLVQAVTLYSSLSEANATATTTFLTGGLEPPQRRAQYLDDLRRATGSLTTLTRELGNSSDTHAAVRTITNQLPVYTGLVESARANNLQGFPVGAAYLRQASARLTGTILPAANQLYAIEARRLGDDYRSATSTTPLVVLGIAVAVLLSILVGAQIYVARISRRILNVWMLLATLVMVAISVWAILGLAGERNALIRAQRNGSDSVEVLTASRVLVSRAQGDQSLTLVNRGADDADPIDFAVVMRALSPNGGLLGEAVALAGRTGTSDSAKPLVAEFAAYRGRAARIATLEKAGRIGDAIHLASSGTSSSLVTRMNADLERQTTLAQRRFMAAAADANSSLSGLSLAIPALIALSATLALIGLRQRMREYR